MSRRGRLAGALVAATLAAAFLAWVASLRATRPVEPATIAEGGAAPVAGLAPSDGGGTRPQPAADAASTQPAAGTAPTQPAAAPGDADPDWARTGVRDVTPAGVTPPPPVTGVLERLPARVVPKPPPGPPKERLLRPVLVDAPGVLKAGAIEVLLPGIRPLDASRVCHDRQGREWPCGARALAALRAFVGGRGVTCVVPADARAGRFTSACRIGQADVAAWLVRHGWALAEDGANRPGELAGLEAEARREKRGQWIEVLAVEPPIRVPDAAAILAPPGSGASTPGSDP